MNLPDQRRAGAAYSSAAPADLSQERLAVGDVAAVASPIGGSVLPIVEDQTLIARRVVEKERVHGAGGGIAGLEVRIDESGCCAVSIRHPCRIAVGAHAGLNHD